MNYWRIMGLVLGAYAIGAFPSSPWWTGLIVGGVGGIITLWYQHKGYVAS